MEVRKNDRGKNGEREKKDLSEERGERINTKSN